MSSIKLSPELEKIWEKLTESEAIISVAANSMNYETDRVSTGRYATLLEMVSKELREAIAILDDLPSKSIN